MKYLFFLCSLVLLQPVLAQIPTGLIGYYSFADCTAVDNNGNPSKEGEIEGNTTCACGVLGGDDKALELKSGGASVTFGGPLVNDFDTENFSISFYFKPTSDKGNQDILSKQEAPCSSESNFSIRYLANSRTVTATLSENSVKKVTVSGKINDDYCWQHVVLVRNARRVTLYINGVFQDDAETATIMDIGNNSPLLIAKSPCQGGQEIGFQGYIDELRLFGRALSGAEVSRLYVRPDQILTSDTLVYLGDSVAIKTSGTCATNFSWSPTAGIDNPSEIAPVIVPTEAGLHTYTLTIDDGSCVATDAIQITVVDPDSLDCSQAFLPNAFTPNGDGLNDLFGVDNPYALQDFISLEVFDRWGSRVFYTTNPFDRWDGNFNGTVINPGVFLYKVVYRCREEEKMQAGSVTMLR